MRTAQVSEIEQRYGIKLSEHEVMILVTTKELLSHIERQERYLMSIDLAPRGCPACLSEICRRSALRDGYEKRIGASHPDEDHWCPKCGTRLVWNVALFGDPFFTIHPDEARPVKS